MTYVNALSILKPIILLMIPLCFCHIVHWKPWHSEWILTLKIYPNGLKLTSCPFFHSSSKKTDQNYSRWLIQIDTVKYLGVLLDDCLLWSKQINHVATKLNQAIGILSKLRNRASLKILKMTYHSLFCSHLYMGLNFGANQI